jgi:hypothetical protein
VVEPWTEVDINLVEASLVETMLEPARDFVLDLSKTTELATYVRAGLMLLGFSIVKLLYGLKSEFFTDF